MRVCDAVRSIIIRLSDAGRRLATEFFSIPAVPTSVLASSNHQSPLQVWFQNARAKWRRSLTKQGNKMPDKCSPDASMEMDMYHGPMGSIQSLPTHSPTYSVMGPPSPNSMDCP